jgi:hypothetical protein
VKATKEKVKDAKVGGSVKSETEVKSSSQVNASKQ